MIKWVIFIFSFLFSSFFKNLLEREKKGEGERKGKRERRSNEGKRGGRRRKWGVKERETSV